MSGSQHTPGTVEFHLRQAGAARRRLLQPDAETSAVIRDLLTVARTVCHAEAAYLSIFVDRKEVLIGRLGAFPKEIPSRASDLKSLLLKKTSYESGDLSHVGEPSLSALTESPWYYRFCAVLPVVIGGAVVGALNVLDRKPRQERLSAEAWTALNALARSLAIFIDHSAPGGGVKDVSFPASKAPKVAATRLQRSLGAAPVSSQRLHRDGLVGFFEADVLNGTARISPSLCRILSLQQREIFPISAIKPCIPRSASHRSFLEERAMKEDSNLEYKIRLGGVVTADPRWLQCQIRVTRDQNGQATQVYGVVSDTSHQDETIRQYSVLTLLGKELRFAEKALDAHRIAARHLGVSLGVDYVQCFSFDVATGEAKEDFGGWSRDEQMPDWTARLRRRGIRPYLTRGMMLAVEDMDEVPWLFDGSETRQPDEMRACLIVPTLFNQQIGHFVMIASKLPRVWRIEDTCFARIVVNWVEAVSNLNEARLGQEFLYREMAHRLKNTLTVVQALARQSLRGCEDQESVRAFERRVHALASANASSMSRRSKKADVRDIARDVLSLIAPLDRFELIGDRVMLGVKTAGYLGLLLNELGTNAIKYGALSNERGVVRLSWVVEGTEEDAVFVMRWVEAEGPSVRSSSRRGFGSQMIHYGLGESCISQINFPRTGCQALFRLPLQKASED